MSCRAEIILNRYQDALFIPLQAVTRVEGQTVVYLPSSREPEMRPVTIGLDNNRVVHILDGLQEGELVLLNPPLADSAAQDESETDTGAFPSESQNSASPAADASAPARKTGKPQQAQTESNGGQNKEATQ